MKRKILALILIFAALLGLPSCKKEEAEPPKEEDKLSFELEEEEEVIEIIYAKTPEEASDKCMDAIYTGDFSSAKQYVLEEGNARAEISRFRSGIKQSLEGISKGVSADKVERLVRNTFNNTLCKRVGVEKNGDKATVSYLISIPDMSGVNFSSYMSEYIASQGMSIEEFMTSLESMTAEENQKWSLELGVDILNYIYESKSSFSRIENKASVVVENRKNGRIVTEINISQS